MVPNHEDCVTSIILEKSIKQRIDNNHALIIPTTNLETKKSCKNIRFTVIKRPSLVKVPHQCEIESENFHFRNEENSFEGEPFLLPEVEIEGNNEDPNIRGHIVLHPIDLDKISKLQWK